MAMVGGLNAKRFAGKPLRQPTYSFKDIPRCSKDLTGSSLQEVNDREQINDAMAEMILLCNETMRRLHIEQKVGKRTAKPLSLEYIADRLDIDDPLFGYFVRTDVSPPNANDKWKKGMLQGFITVTTFTNWQKTFRWDSMHDSAFAYDDEALAEAMASGVRRYDEDGSLAEALQSTVRCGDPYNEGIVWPRIAEISLLGGMGCGKALVSLVIEKLECMKANCKRNYDYVALQATENSIPFYESLGFVRVGGITEDEKYEEKQAKLRGEESPTQDSPSTSSDAASPRPQSEIVSSPVDVYVTEVAGETPADIAKKLNANVWDIIFLNHYVYPDIGTRSRLMKDTSLFVPAAEDAQVQASSHATRSQDLGAEPSAPQWYIADENDTPRMIAKNFDVSCTELVNANRSRLPELQWQSRLKEGTRIKVSHFHVDDDKHVPYCHWTFPDDSFETSEPSYMMVRKLNRRKGQQAKIKPVEASLAVPVAEFSAPLSELFNEVQPSPAPNAKAKTPKSNKKHPAEPKKPKRPLSGYMIYCSEQRELMQDDLVGMKGPEAMKILSKMWRELPESDRASYQAKQAKEQSRYRKAMEKYEKDLASFYEANPQLKQSSGADGTDAKSQTLFNKVVRLNDEGMAQAGSEYEYYFVLTYIPDLCWAHLAPLECVGKWGPDKPKAEGRPIWMLVDESEGKEVDISGSFCIPVRSRAMKRTVDADCEQWDIVESDASTPVSARKIRLAPVFTNRASDGNSSLQSRSAMKPLTGSIEKQGKVKKKRGRPRKHPLPEPVAVESTPKKRGRPPKQQQHSATKPLSGSIEPKKRGPGRPKKHRLPEPDAGSLSPLTGFVKPKKRGPGPDRPYKQPLPESDAKKPVAKRRGRPPKQAVSPSSLAEDDDWENETEKPKRRGPPRKSRSATKPLGGALEPVKRKRGRSSRQMLSSDDTGDEDCEIQAVKPKKRGRPSKRRVSEESRPTKRRKLPRRHSASAVGSYRDVVQSDVDEVEMTPAKPTPKKRKGTPSRSAASDWTLDVQPGSSPFRTMALTRSAKKLSMTSPLMFSPRRGRVRG